MYLRRTKVRHGSTTYLYWQLVETVRTERGVKQRIVAHLGKLDNFTDDQWKALASKMGKPDMADKLREHVKAPAGKTGRPSQTLVLESDQPGHVLPIKVDSVSWEDPREFGDVYAGLEMWKRLGLADLLEEKLSDTKHEIAMPIVAALIGVGRLVSPTSELATVRWYKTTALPELLGISRDAIDEDRLYACLDKVWPHKDAIEKHLQHEGETLFKQSYHMLLYDLSSTYFEGRAVGTPKAKRGYSRDHRPDCLQICFGVVVTNEGWPTGYETFEGNIRDHQTLEGLLKKLEQRFGKPKAVDQSEDSERIMVMDRGLLTDDNLKKLRDNHYGYILAERRAKAAKWYWKLGKESNWIIVRHSEDNKIEIEVQEIGNDGPDRLILVRSAGCKQKEYGMHDRVLCRLKEDLQAMKLTLEKGKLKDPDKIQQRLGRLQERHGSIWKWVKVQVSPNKETDHWSLNWEIQTDIQQAMHQAEGVYLLRTNLPKRSATEVLQDYLRLTVVESVFRAMKHDLLIRPIFHRKEARVEAHVLFSFLAYVLYWTLEREHRSTGGKLTGRRILEALRQIKLGTIRLRTTGGQWLSLKRVSKPSKEIAYILNTLNLPLPRSTAEPTVLNLSRRRQK